MHSTKTITELRNSLFETFDAVVEGDVHHITHKNGRSIAMISIEKIEQLTEEIDLHKKLAIGYAQAIRGEGITTAELESRLKKKEQQLRQKFA
ncbi:MAG: prevent-host-death family protein [Polaribacter sp.]|jgi:prevent-host-death family protein